MVIGWGLKQIGMLDDHFVTVCNKFNFKVTLPVLLFRDISGVDIRAVFDLQYVLFCALATSSAAVMGLAFIQNIYGQSAMGPLMIVGAVPLYNIYSVIVLTFEGQGGDGEKDTGKIKTACVNILKNPIIIAIFLGLVVSLCKIQFPVIVQKTVNSVSQMATPLALVAMGAGFEGRKALAKLKPALAASFVKLVAQALVFVPLAVFLGFEGEKLIAIVVMLAAPTTPSCYIMAKNMKNDGVLTASTVVITTLLAAFTLTGWIYILKCTGFIG